MKDELKKIVDFYGKSDFTHLLFRTFEVILFGITNRSDTPKELQAFLLLLMESLHNGDENPFKIALAGKTRNEFLKNLQEWMEYVTFFVKKEGYSMQYVDFMFFCYQMQNALEGNHR